MNDTADRSFLARAARSSATLIALFLFFLPPLYAQMTTADCPVNGGGTSRGTGADIQCRLNNILNKNGALLNTVQTVMPPCDGTDAKCKIANDALTNAGKAQSHAMKANARLKPNDFGDLNVVRKEKCQSPKKSDCASGNGTYSGDDSDATVGMDLADRLDDATTALSDANDALNEASATSSAVVRQMEATPPATFKPLYNFENDPNYPQWLHTAPNPEAQWLTAVRYSISMADFALDKARDLAEDLCKQDVVVAGEGGNTSSACEVLTAVWLVTAAVNKRIEYSESNELAWVVHGTYEREDDLNSNLGQVDSDVIGVSAAVGNTQDQINELTAQVSKLQNSVNALQTQLAAVGDELSEKAYVNRDMNKQILQLLLVPDGGRTVPASLLNCTGDNGTPNPCPAVNINCSLQTGVCKYSAH